MSQLVEAIELAVREWLGENTHLERYHHTGPDKIMGRVALTFTRGSNFPAPMGEIMEYHTNVHYNGIMLAQLWFFETVVIVECKAKTGIYLIPPIALEYTNHRTMNILEGQLKSIQKHATK